MTQSFDGPVPVPTPSASTTTSNRHSDTDIDTDTDANNTYNDGTNAKASASTNTNAQKVDAESETNSQMQSEIEPLRKDRKLNAATESNSDRTMSLTDAELKQLEKKLSEITIVAPKGSNGKVNLREVAVKEKSHVDHDEGVEDDRGAKSPSVVNPFFNADDSGIEVNGQDEIKEVVNEVKEDLNEGQAMTDEMKEDEITKESGGKIRKFLKSLPRTESQEEFGGNLRSQIDQQRAKREQVKSKVGSVNVLKTASGDFKSDAGKSDEFEKADETSENLNEVESVGASSKNSRSSRKSVEKEVKFDLKEETHVNDAKEIDVNNESSNNMKMNGETEGVNERNPVVDEMVLSPVNGELNGEKDAEIKEVSLVSNTSKRSDRSHGSKRSRINKLNKVSGAVEDPVKELVVELDLIENEETISHFSDSTKNGRRNSSKLVDKLNKLEEAINSENDDPVDKLTKFEDGLGIGNQVDEKKASMPFSVVPILESVEEIKTKHVEAVQAKLEESNLANYGTKEHHEAVKEAAETDKELIGCGQKTGLEIWRVENKKKTVAKEEHGLTFKEVQVNFGIKRWPKNEYGNFYEGDSYIILNTYRNRDNEAEVSFDKLAYDVHFWLGKFSSQDEKGVAAYKTVEIDELLNGAPIQHREIQGRESGLFLSYFKTTGVRYMKGGIESGFVHVKKDEYKPRLLLVKQHRKVIRTIELPFELKSLHRKNCYVLDAGDKITSFFGSEARAIEKFHAGVIVDNLINARFGKAKRGKEKDIFAHLGGDESEVDKNEEIAFDMHDPETLDKSSVSVYRISDNNDAGELKFTKENEGEKKINMMFFEDNGNQDDVFLIHSNIGIFVWVGKGASKQEKTKAMDIADKYMKSQGLSEDFPVTRLRQDQAAKSNAFLSLFSWY